MEISENVWKFWRQSLAPDFGAGFWRRTLAPDFEIFGNFLRLPSVYLTFTCVYLRLPAFTCVYLRLPVAGLNFLEISENFWKFLKIFGNF